jgi:hypothetical protein
MEGDNARPWSNNFKNRPEWTLLPTLSGGCGMGVVTIETKRC